MGKEARNGGAGGAGGGIVLFISNREWQTIGDRLDIPHRQVQMIQAMMQGQAKPETIAHSLHIQPSSVKTHMQRLYRKLDAHQRTQVIIKVFIELLDMRAPKARPPARHR